MPIAALPPPIAQPDFCVVSRWNLSLPAKARWQIFAFLAAVSLTVALAFVVAGAWMVLPYSVIELAVLAAAFRYLERRAADWERLTVVADRVILERCTAGRRETREWNRPWVRVQLTDARFGHPARLLLQCGAEQWEFGGALPEAERATVAKEIKRLTTARCTG